jgi:hypothetical protein
MKALTVFQPYAHLLVLPEDHPQAKPMENRRRYFSFRGALLIHAGRSQEMLEPEDIAEWPDMVFGALVGMVDIYDCVHVDKLPTELRNHQHAHGPFCLLRRNVRKFPTPIPCRGAQGIWYVEPAVERLVREQMDASGEGRP